MLAQKALPGFLHVLLPESQKACMQWAGIHHDLRMHTCALPMRYVAACNFLRFLSRLCTSREGSEDHARTAAPTLSANALQAKHRKSTNREEHMQMIAFRFPSSSLCPENAQPSRSLCQWFSGSTGTIPSAQAVFLYRKGHCREAS